MKLMEPPRPKKFPIYRAKCTNFPKLFERTYWNTQLQNEREWRENLAILSNRDEFALKYNIKNRPNSWPNWMRELVEKFRNSAWREFDHPEVYKDFDKNWVVVISPYGDNHDVDGWKEIPPIYHARAKTYVRILHNK